MATYKIVYENDSRPDMPILVWAESEDEALKTFREHDSLAVNPVARLIPPLKLEQVDTDETERIMAELLTDDKNVSFFFKKSFFERLEALNGRR